MNPDITANPTYQLMLGQSLKAANQLGQQGIQSVLARAAQSGFGEDSPFAQSQLDRAARANTALQSNAFSQNLFAADQRRQNATRSAMGYQPLVTGQTGDQTTKTSGLGTWLPQVAGMGLAAATAPFTGGMSLMGAGAPFIPSGTTGMSEPSLPMSAPPAWAGSNPFAGINLNPTTQVSAGFIDPRSYGGTPIPGVMY
jgi:hypothetical protein